jgi:hypothetical protein
MAAVNEHKAVYSAEIGLRGLGLARASHYRWQ